MTELIITYVEAGVVGVAVVSASGVGGVTTIGSGAGTGSGTVTGVEEDSLGGVVELVAEVSGVVVEVNAVGAEGVTLAGV